MNHLVCLYPQFKSELLLSCLPIQSQYFKILLPLSWLLSGLSEMLRKILWLWCACVTHQNEQISTLQLWKDSLIVLKSQYLRQIAYERTYLEPITEVHNMSASTDAIQNWVWAWNSTCPQTQAQGQVASGQPRKIKHTHTPKYLTLLHPAYDLDSKNENRVIRNAILIFYTSILFIFSSFDFYTKSHNFFFFMNYCSD